MADEVGLIVNVRTRAAPGQLDRLRADVNGAVQQGAQKAFEKPAPIKGLLNDFRTKYDPAKGFTEKVPGAVPPTKKADPMSGIFGGGGGGAGGMLGPLAALTIVGQGIFGAITKVMDILATASPALGASLKLIQKTLMMFLRPIGDLLASFLRPIARMMLDANRQARREALKYGRPGSIAYTAVYTGALIYNLIMGIRDGVRAAMELVLDSLFGPGTFQKISEFFHAFDNAVLGGIKATLDFISGVITAIKDLVDEIANPLGIDTGTPTTSIPGDRFSDSTYEKYASGDWLGAALQDTYEMIFKRKWFPWFASGGYVPSTPGGRIVGLAEGGEGEWIVPDSKVRGFAQSVLGGGTVVNNLYLQGPVFGVDDLDRRVMRLMDATAKRSRRS